MPQEANIEFFRPDTLPGNHLTYVIIGAREGNNWIFVRHRERESWELPAGHIEKGESPDAAAKRELFEETGTLESELQPIHDYSVTMNGSTLYGRIYFARVSRRGDLPATEIEEVVTSAHSPQPATYPYAHWKFIEVLEAFLKGDQSLP
jgi:8-oxo-dGTP diphosphatase